jgi:hypothetical protein
MKSATFGILLLLFLLSRPSRAQAGATVRSSGRRRRRPPSALPLIVQNAELAIRSPVKAGARLTPTLIEDYCTKTLR